MRLKGDCFQMVKRSELKSGFKTCLSSTQLLHRYIEEAPLSTHAVLYKSQAEVDRECACCASNLTGAGRVYYHCAQPPKVWAGVSLTHRLTHELERC